MSTTTEYLVQAMSRSTGASGRWVPVGYPTTRLGTAEGLAMERRAKNGHRVVYRIVSREVTPWAPVTS